MNETIETAFAISSEGTALRGARYYACPLRRDSYNGRLPGREVNWLSVDPLADKYPGWSPYNYCMNNPLIIIDPDGMIIWITTGGKGADGNDILVEYANGNLYNNDGSLYKGTSEFALAVQDGICRLLGMNDETITQRINDLVGDNLCHKISNLEQIGGTAGTTPTSTMDDEDQANIGRPANTESSVILNHDKNGKASIPLTTLGHELGHSWDYSKGNLSIKTRYEFNESHPNSADYAEVLAVEFENLVRNHLSPGNLKTTYNGKNIDFIHKSKMAR